MNKCISCGSKENLTELDNKGSNEFICDECACKVR